MACFLVPMGEAIIVSAVKKVVEKKERETMIAKTSQNESSAIISETSNRLNWSRKLSWLTRLLWGGVILLAYEHLWHGEIVPWPPFLTAMENPAEIGPMFHELATVGTGMAIFVTVVWIIMVLIAEQKAKAVSTTIKKTV